MEGRGRYDEISEVERQQAQEATKNLRQPERALDVGEKKENMAISKEMASTKRPRKGKQRASFLEAFDRGSSMAPLGSSEEKQCAQQICQAEKRQLQERVAMFESLKTRIVKLELLKQRVDEFELFKERMEEFMEILKAKLEQPQAHEGEMEQPGTGGGELEQSKARLRDCAHLEAHEGELDQGTEVRMEAREAELEQPVAREQELEQPEARQGDLQQPEAPQGELEPPETEVKLESAVPQMREDSSAIIPRTSASIFPWLSSEPFPLPVSLPFVASEWNPSSASFPTDIINDAGRESLRKKGEALIKRARERNLEQVRVLLNDHVSPNYAKLNGETALMVASFQGYEDMVSLLIESGANVLAKNRPKGHTALHYAARGRNYRTIPLLVEAGAHVDSKGHLGETPLYCASRLGNEEAVRALLDAGASIDEADVKGKRPWNVTKCPAIKELLRRTSTSASSYTTSQTGSISWCSEEGAATDGEKEGCRLMTFEGAGLEKDESAQQEGRLIPGAPPPNCYTSMPSTVSALIPPSSSSTGVSGSSLVLAFRTAVAPPQQTSTASASPTTTVSASPTTSVQLQKVQGSIKSGGAKEAVCSGKVINENAQLEVRSLPEAPSLCHPSVASESLSSTTSTPPPVPIHAGPEEVQGTLKRARSAERMGELTKKKLVCRNSPSCCSTSASKASFDSTVRPSGASESRNSAPSDRPSTPVTPVRRKSLGKKLIKAAKGDKSIEDLLKLLDAGADINFTDKKGRTPLMFASALAHACVTSQLLDRGADIHVKRGSLARTALHHAARNDLSGRCVRLLVNAGAPVNCRDRKRWTPLHDAADGGNEAAVRELLAAGASKIVKNTDGKTPLDLAKSNRIRKLLFSANANARSGTTEYAFVKKVNGTLQRATSNGKRAEVRKKEVSAVLDTCCVSASTSPPVYRPSLTSRPETSTSTATTSASTFLSESSSTRVTFPSVAPESQSVTAFASTSSSIASSETSSAQAFRTSVASPENEFHTEVPQTTSTQLQEMQSNLKSGGAKEELRSGKMIDESPQLERYKLQTLTASTQSPPSDYPAKQRALGEKLMRCARRGKVKDVCSLLAKEAKVNYVDAQGKTPVMMACYNGHESVVIVLLKQGADVHAEDRFGWSALHYAVRYKGSGKCVESLLEARAPVDKHDKIGVTPLHLAVRICNEGAMRALLGAGASVESSTIDGSTPLHVAAQCGNEMAVRMLVQSGARVNIKNEMCSTPLHVAAKYDKAEIVRSLMDAGAQLNIHDANGDTPLKVAMENGAEKAVRALLAAGASSTEGQIREDGVGLGLRRPSPQTTLPPELEVSE